MSPKKNWIMTAASATVASVVAVYAFDKSLGGFRWLIASFDDVWKSKS